MLDENYIVEKSKPLVWAQFRDYGVGELKILDTYLSRINARDPDSSLVMFTKKEYAELMGIDQDVRTEQLKTYTRGLLSNVVTIDLPGEGYVQYPLFSEAKCYYDKDLGQVAIKIECNEKLKPAFFSLAQNGYVKYELKNVIALRSQYSIRLYPRLKDRPFGWTVELDELRKLLGATAASYDVFKDFNKCVLQKAIKEINEITDITVETENIRRGRSVAAIKFIVKQKAPALPEPPPEDGEENEGENLSLFGPDEEKPDDPMVFYSGALDDQFTREQVQVLVDLAIPHLPFDATMDLYDKQMWTYHYLQGKFLLMKASGAQNPFAWLRKAVDEDWK